MKNKFIFSTLFVISGCTTDPIVTDSAPEYVPVDVMAVADAIPRYEKRTRAGNPKNYEVLGQHYTVLADSIGYQQRGIASWYGTKFHGRKTSNGEIYDMYGMTAAHKTLPIPSYVRVINLKNQRSVVVRINDRGPFHGNRIIDLSYAAAVKLGIQQAGTGYVEVTTIEPAVQESVAAVKPVKQTASEKLYLQIGAFSNQFNARQLQEKVSAIQLADARLKVSQSQGDTLYKVQIGPLVSIENVDQINTRLAAIGVTVTKLVTDD